jgi:hypothetical protein
MSAIAPIAILQAGQLMLPSTLLNHLFDCV